MDLRSLKGYWAAHPPNEESVLKGYSELGLTILFVSKTLKNAEDHALKAGRMFSALTSAFGGYPVDPPRLNRIALVDVLGKLTSQHNYSYDDQLHKSLGEPFDSRIEHQYKRYLNSFSTKGRGHKISATVGGTLVWGCGWSRRPNR